MEEVDITQTPIQGNADELKDQIKLKALNSFYYFSKVVLGYDKMVGHFHLPVCEHIQNSEEQRKRGVLMQRGSFKSTIVGKGYPLWRTCRLPYLVRDENGKSTGVCSLEAYNPELLGCFRTLIVGESDTVAKKDLKDPKWHVENNQLFRWLFSELIPVDLNKTKWTDTEILLNRSKSYDESTIMTAGVGARMTGHHFDLIIYEDIIGEAAAQSQAVMEDACEWFDYAPGLLDDPANGEEILIGTRWKHGKADLYGKIMEQLPEERLASGRVTGFKWYIRSATENGVPTFPERFPIEVLEEIRHRLGDYKYFCQYENNPIAPGTSIFNSEDLREYYVAEDKQTLTPTNGGPAVRLVRLYRIQVYDPATRSQKSKALPAVVGVGEDSLHRMFVLDTWSEKGSMGDGVEKMHVFHDRYRFSVSYYELAGQQQAVEDIELERQSQTTCRKCDKVHTKMRLEPVKARATDLSKEERIIEFLQTRIQEHRLFLRRGMNQLRKQIVEFPNGDTVDLLDALAYCSHLSRSPLSEAEIEDLEEQKETIRTPREPRTNAERSYGGYI